jgi:hypothetical protein
MCSRNKFVKTPELATCLYFTTTETEMIIFSYCSLLYFSHLFIHSFLLKIYLNKNFDLSINDTVHFSLFHNQSQMHKNYNFYLVLIESSTLKSKRSLATSIKIFFYDLMTARYYYYKPLWYSG